jgi:hypothetical protein
MTILYGVPRALCSLVIGGAAASMIAETLIKSVVLNAAPIVRNFNSGHDAFFFGISPTDRPSRTQAEARQRCGEATGHDPQGHPAEMGPRGRDAAVLSSLLSLLYQQRNGSGQWKSPLSRRHARRKQRERSTRGKGKRGSTRRTPNTSPKREYFVQLARFSSSVSLSPHSSSPISHNPYQLPVCGTHMSYSTS